jgi:hypothetical protein
LRVFSRCVFVSGSSDSEGSGASPAFGAVVHQSPLQLLALRERWASKLGWVLYKGSSITKNVSDRERRGILQLASIEGNLRADRQTHT